MKHKLWTAHLIGIVLLTAAYVLHTHGQRGDLRSPYLHNHVYPALQRVSVFFSDFKFRVRGPVPVKNPIVLVEIDGEALEKLGRWPWPRDLIAKLIRNIFSAGASNVGLDIIFSEPQDSVPPELAAELETRRLGGLLAPFDFDGKLANVIGQFPDHLVLSWASETPCQPGMSYEMECPVDNPIARSYLPKDMARFQFGQVRYDPGFRASQSPVASAVTVIPNIARLNQPARHGGFANSFRDADGLTRRSSLVMMVGGEPYPSLALELAALQRNESLAVTLDGRGGIRDLTFSRSSTRIPVSSSGSLPINFRGPSQTFPRVSALDIFEAFDDSGKLVRPENIVPLKRAAALVGVTALAVNDVAATPFDRTIAGVEVNATILDNLLSGDWIRTDGSGIGFWVILALMTLGGTTISYFTQNLEGRPALLGFLLAFGTIGMVDFKILFPRNIDLGTGFLYLDWLGILSSSLVAKYLREEKSKNLLRSAFSKYVAPAVVDSILANPGSLGLSGRKQPATILFSDLRGFTTFAEGVDGKVLVDFLNEYFGLMTGVLFEYQGTLDKYIGDSVMAFWGAPLVQPDHALRACQAAVAMAQEASRHRERMKQKYGFDLRMGIGLHSGLVTVGNLGSEMNLNFTAIGDGVNLASRLQSATKLFGAEVLVSEETLEEIRRTGATPPAYRSLGPIMVKGKALPVAVAELMTRPVSDEKREYFEQGRLLFQKGRWAAAKELFLKAMDPEDRVCGAFIQRCETYLAGQSDPAGTAWTTAA